MAERAMRSGGRILIDQLVAQRVERVYCVPGESYLAALDAIEWRLRDKDVVPIDQFAHVTEEKGEQEGADVAAVNIRIGHQNDFVVAQFGGIKVVFADTGAQRGDDGADLFVAEHLVIAGFFDVEYFAFEREDRLIAAIASTFGRAPGRFTLYDEEFAARRVAFLAIGEFPRQARGIQR